MHQPALETLSRAYLSHPQTADWRACYPLQGLGKYDPCAKPGVATRTRGLYLGIAFWPGGTVEDWKPYYDKELDEFGLNPCNDQNNFNNSGLSDRAYLAQQGVVFATYELKVDTLTSMRINETDLAAVFNSAPNTRPAVVSAVIFRSGFRSEARYVVSEDAATSHGIGYVQTLAVIASFKKGNLQYLQWNDQTCNSCGGQSDVRCMIAMTTGGDQHSCAVAASQCLMQGGTTDCSLTAYVGYSGDDKNGVPFVTGQQIARVNQYAVTGLYDNAKQQIKNVLASASTGLVGENAPVPGDSSSGDAARR
ncbi:hypothetical protein WJX72_011663 [[Myrmecia] bisecta]|uniref:Uncharacterized protein n=1 Tax=[Myrmecia] bisecta TaxID=41462 RepID=A0AAW1QGR4_9CHLO